MFHAGQILNPNQLASSRPIFSKFTTREFVVTSLPLFVQPSYWINDTVVRAAAGEPTQVNGPIRCEKFVSLFGNRTCGLVSPQGNSPLVNNLCIEHALCTLSSGLFPLPSHCLFRFWSVSPEKNMLRFSLRSGFWIAFQCSWNQLLFKVKFWLELNRLSPQKMVCFLYYYQLTVSDLVYSICKDFKINFQVFSMSLQSAILAP